MSKTSITLKNAANADAVFNLVNTSSKDAVYLLTGASLANPRMLRINSTVQPLGQNGGKDRAVLNVNYSNTESVPTNAFYGKKMSIDLTLTVTSSRGLNAIDSVTAKDLRAYLASVIDSDTLFGDLLNGNLSK